MPSKRCDLHTHSCFSDGTCTPAELLELAAGAGLSALALTDHNTAAGLPDFLEAAKNHPLQPIPGVEISAEYGETELHILGLFLSPDHFDSVTAFLRPFLLRKEESNLQLVQALGKAGYRLDYGEILRDHPQGTVNRATIAAALLEKGYIGSIREGFQTLLSKKGGYYVPPERPDALGAIDFLRSIRAVPVLAHPFLNLKTETALRAFLQEAVSHGLAGMETLYPAFSPEATALARTLAREFGLAESGGSDFHGAAKPHIPLGQPEVPLSFAGTLQKCR